MNKQEFERIQELISIEDVEAISSMLEEKQKNEEILAFEIQSNDGIICVDILEPYLFDAKFWHRIFVDEIFTNLIYE